MNRRDFIRLTGGAIAAGGLVGLPYLAFGAARKVVVVGGGVGGCTAAKYLRMMDPGVAVTLVTDKKHYITAYMSNEVVSGERNLDSLTFGYDGLKRYGVEVVIDPVVDIDPVSKRVQTAGGKRLGYDACVVSPGVDYKWDQIAGHSEALVETITHAWDAGPQTLTLRNQIMEMPDGGTVIIVSPPNPYKCPPGPYERASLIAEYFKGHKPRSKIIILDFKDAFTMQELFFQGWERFYGYGTDDSMIEWVPGAEGGLVEELDPDTMTLICQVEDFEADVINIIPAQKAGKIAFAADLVEDDWCPVDKETFESTRHAGIYVLGDASDASNMPKSAYAANSQAKVAAAAIVNRLNGLEPDAGVYVNTCYSIVGKEFGMSAAAVYELNAADNILESIEGSGGYSPIDASAKNRRREVSYAHSWFRNIMDDMMQ
jgi:sulfide dehydrogenase [flavocytochrome c] flavoprotein subunit